MWIWLADFVGGADERDGEGRAGWGVWCIRDLEVVGMQNEKGKEKEKEERRGDRGKREEEVLMIYCWGEIVKEVLVILVCSSGQEWKTEGLRAVWFDAKGEGVIVGRAWKETVT